MVSAADVRDLLAQAEAFRRADDPYGAVVRAREAARAAESAFDANAEVSEEVRLALERFEAAARAAREEAERRGELQQANESRMARVVADVGA